MTSRFNDQPIHGMDGFDFSDRRVLVRTDHNVPCTSDGQTRSDERIGSLLPRLCWLLI
ncbi:phosphoglycerate kinase [Stieleria sp. TO1_6]|uniref:phosphoglycerate kinase n=1 Tax=Stieleria tagensis TaxID=2956795 RepID=UPI00209AF3FD|nr:phosphoglycerate kinase [Stieleria tagensis]MCO8124561.1 phosphoglycerate kinase [Stieleria tagensis]